MLGFPEADKPNLIACSRAKRLHFRGLTCVSNCELALTATEGLPEAEIKNLAVRAKRISARARGSTLNLASTFAAKLALAETWIAQRARPSMLGDALTEKENCDEAFPYCEALARPKKLIAATPASPWACPLKLKVDRAWIAGLDEAEILKLVGDLTRTDSFARVLNKTELRPDARTIGLAWAWNVSEARDPR